MITVRRSQERGRTALDWLESRHSFSFGDYFDSANMGFRSLRVINEDWIKPGAGFGMHPHRDMEIITYVVKGQLEHRDSLGSGSVIGPGDVQRMTAGTGILHSEFNPSAAEPVHLLQIWIVPEKKGLKPGYEEKRFSEDERRGQLRVVAAPEGQGGAVTIRQDVEVASAILEKGEAVGKKLDPNRHAWVQLVRGVVKVNGQQLQPGDAAAISAEPEVRIAAEEPAEVLLFDLA